jgi:hypothetical protein
MKFWAFHVGNHRGDAEKGNKAISPKEVQIQNFARWCYQRTNMHRLTAFYKDGFGN